jgi:MFS transporter, OFA family, oxalate/formate antiporter
MMDYPENTHTSAVSEGSAHGSSIGSRIKKHWILSSLVVVVALLCVWLLVREFSKPKAKPSGPPAIQVTTAPVKLGNIDVYLDALGTVTPVYTVTVVSRVAGQITEVRFKEGQSVKKTEGLSSGQMLKTPVFWLMFAMMTMMSTSGLMVISQMASFSKDFGITSATIFGMGALPLALTMDRFTNGLTRPFFGWVSDRIGREPTMCIAFGLEAIAMTLWLLTRDNTLLFVLFSGLVFFGWGEIFSLFPSTLTDTFGEKHATTNYGFLYMAQGIGSIFGGPLAARLHEASGSWLPVFAVVISLDVLTALLAIAVLKPMRHKYLRANALIEGSLTAGESSPANIESRSF